MTAISISDLAKSSAFPKIRPVAKVMPADDEQCYLEPTEQGDLFNAIGLPSAVKGDLLSLEYPVFSLSKNRMTDIVTYSKGGKTIKIVPSAYGSATIFDYDLLIYAISHMVKAADNGINVSRRIRIHVKSFFEHTKRSTGGASYARVLDMLRRLKGTSIETNIRTNAVEQVEGFGLIDDFKILRYTNDNKGALEFEMTLSDWIFRNAMTNGVLTMNAEYFDIGGGLERRLYQIARKHCGGQAWFEIGLPALMEKSGSKQSPRDFMRMFAGGGCLETLPGYRVVIDDSVRPPKVVFLNRDSKTLHLEAVRTKRIEWLNRLLQARPKKAA